jgi:pectinesterase
MSPHNPARLLKAAFFIAIGFHPQPSPAQDVHVRVSSDVKTGIEGTTEFPTIQMALDHHPFAGIGSDGKPGRVFIGIAPGVYHERVIITQNHTNITLIGMGASPSDVVISNSLNAKQAGGTFFTETVEVNGIGFEADNLTFENTAGNTGQAVAIAVRADRAVFKHCHFLGHQDTLFADYGRQYYVDSYIEGGVDFIFGNAAAVFDRSEIHANAPGWLTAQSRTSPDQTTGYVILNSRVTSSIEHAPAAAAGDSSASGSGSLSSVAGSQSSVSGSASTDSASPLPSAGSTSKEVTSLGRPWRPYSRVVYINTWLCADVTPQGWKSWGKTPAIPQAFYAEFNDTGPGANPAARVPWSHQLTTAEAEQFKPKVFLGGLDHWDADAEAAKLP